MPFISVRDLFPILKLNLSGVRFTSEVVWWASELLMNLSPLGFYLKIVSAPFVYFNSGCVRPCGCSDHGVTSSYSCTWQSKFLTWKWVSFPIGMAGSGEDLPSPLLRISLLPGKAIVGWEVTSLLWSRQLTCNIFTFIPTSSFQGS